MAGNIQYEQQSLQKYDFASSENSLQWKKLLFVKLHIIA